MAPPLAPLAVLTAVGLCSATPRSKDQLDLLQAWAEPDEDPGYKRYIWAFWEYKSEPSAWVSLNLDSWRKNAPDFEIRLVNDSNLKDYVPDLPEEYYRLPYSSAKSDLIRAALLYHHGGVYMDTDFLLMRSLDPVLELLKTSDVVGYRTHPDMPNNTCGLGFSSNFMAGRRHNKFSYTWWTNVKIKLTRMCDEEEWMFEKVCCNVRGVETQTKTCHIPWAQLEHIKMPEQDHDKKPLHADPTKDTSKIKGQMLKAKSGVSDPLIPHPNGTVFSCFSGRESFAPHRNGEIYWSRWDSRNGTTLNPGGKGSKLRWDQYTGGYDCNLLGPDLHCNSGNWPKGQKRIFPDFMNRIAYHLFFSTTHRQLRDKKQALNSDYFLSALYRKALGMPDL